MKIIPYLGTATVSGSSQLERDLSQPTCPSSAQGRTCWGPAACSLASPSPPSQQSLRTRAGAWLGQQEPLDSRFNNSNLLGDFLSEWEYWKTGQLGIYIQTKLKNYEVILIYLVILRLGTSTGLFCFIFNKYYWWDAFSNIKKHICNIGLLKPIA